MNTISVYEIRAEFLSYRCFGDAKIARPKILKGLKPVAKFRIIGKDAQMFLPDDGSVVVYFPEMFCKYVTVPKSEDADLPTSALQRKYPWYPRKKSGDRFVYADGWCKAFRRNEGYVRLTGLREQFACVPCDWPFTPMVAGEVYRCIEGLSEKDNRFYRLNGTCEQSMAYMRVASDIVNWIARQAKENFQKGKCKDGCKQQVKLHDRNQQLQH